MTMINYKLNVCRITVASKLLLRNNYFPLFRVLTPSDAARELALQCGGAFKPKNHYIPVFLSAGKRRSSPRKCRPHYRLEDFRYMSIQFEVSRHGRLLALLDSKPVRLRGHYVYRVDARDTCLVLDGSLEQAARAGEIIDLTIADNSDKIILRLKGGDKLTAEAKDYSNDKTPDRPKLYEGQVTTSREYESKHHHYGRSTMSIAHIFEMKERSAALHELEKLQFEAKRRQRAEREWKEGITPLLANLRTEKNRGDSTMQEPQEQVIAAGMRVPDMTHTLDVSSKFVDSDQVHMLPLIGQVNKLVRHCLGHGQYTVLADTTGVLVPVDDQEFFIVGQTLFTENGEKLFVPGQTFHTGNTMQYMPGITINLDNTPTFVAGVVFADEKDLPVFLPGQTVIVDGNLVLPKQGEHITPTGMKKLQMSEEEQTQRVHKCKMERKKLKKENKKRMAAIMAEMQTDCQLSLDAQSENVTCLAESEQHESNILVTNAVDDQIPPKVNGNNNVDGFSVIGAEGTPDIEDKTMEQSETLRVFNEQISKGSFLQDHRLCLLPDIPADEFEKDPDVLKARRLQEKLDEEHEMNARAADDMRQVIDALELKKIKLMEKLKNIQNETATIEDRAVTYIYPAKANALAVELGFIGREARDAGKILLGIARWASGYSAKFLVHAENIEAPVCIDESEFPEFETIGNEKLGDDLQTALRAGMVAAVEVFRERPRDLEAGMRAAGKELVRHIASCEYPERIILEMCTAVQTRTNSERNVIFSNTLKDLTKKIVVNKADTLRSIIREHYSPEKVVAKMNLIVEDEGDILVRAFTNLSIKNDDFVRGVHDMVFSLASEAESEENAASVAHRSIVYAVQELYDRQLDLFLRKADAHEIGHLLLEARSLAQLIGMRNEARTLERLIGEDDCMSVRVQAADQITLDLIRRALVMRRLAERNPHLAAGMAALRRSIGLGRCIGANDSNVRELVRESAALVSYVCPVLSSLEIPSFLFELSDSMAMEDYIVQRMKRSGALLISCRGVQAVVPKEASRFVLAGLVDYTLIDDEGVTHFRPMHVFNALKLDKKHERRYHDYSCVGAFDKYAYSVPIREYGNPDYRYLADTPCTSEVCTIGGGLDANKYFIEKERRRVDKVARAGKEKKNKMMNGQAEAAAAAPRA